MSEQEVEPEKVYKWYLDTDGETQRLRVDDTWTDVWRRPANDTVHSTLGVVRKHLLWDALTALELARIPNFGTPMDGIWVEFAPSSLFFTAANAEFIATYYVPWQEDARLKGGAQLRLLPSVIPLAVQSKDDSYRLSLGEGLRTSALLLDDVMGGDRFGLGVDLASRLHVQDRPPYDDRLATLDNEALRQLQEMLLTFNGPAALEFRHNVLTVRNGTRVIGSVDTKMGGGAFTIEATQAHLLMAVVVVAMHDAGGPLVFLMGTTGVVTITNLKADGNQIDATVTVDLAMTGSGVTLARAVPQFSAAELAPDAASAPPRLPPLPPR